MDSQDEPTVVCSNCDRAIAESKSFLHEAYCFRNIIRCSKCNEPINKNEVDAHDKENHNLVPCKHCRKDFEAKLLGNHVENCPQKPKFCQFCKCEISSEEFLDHIYQCGSRTRQCAFCNKSILVRDLESHEAACEVEQFTRQEAGLEENTFEDSLDLPPRREAVAETRSIPRKRFEPVKKELNEQNKKRLTKLSNKRGSLEEEGIEQISNEEFDVGVAAGTRRQRGYERQKTQEELDEEMARELNDEYYHGKNPNKKKINEKSRSKAFQNQDDDDFIENDDIEEEFFGTKKEKRITRLDKKKTVEENEFSNGSRRNAPTTRNAKRQTKNQPTYTYDEEDENYNYEEQEEEEEAEYSPMVETRGGSKKTTGQRQNEIDPEMHQFYDDGEDAELQRAIQASLESFQN